MTEIEQRLASWREVAGLGTPSVAAGRTTDWVAEHHRQQLERSALLTLENLKAHDQFCKDIEAYVIAGSSERSEEHQQRVTDYAGYLLRMYENTGASALERALFKVLQDKFEAVQVIRTVRPAPTSELPPQRSWLHRFLIG
jgi:hypothetical protein